MQTALLLVDVQQDFLARPGLTPEREVVCQQLADLLQLVRQQGWPVIHVITEMTADGRGAMPHWRNQGVMQCVAGSAGAKAPQGLQPIAGELCLVKPFFSAFGNPQLLIQLHGLGVRRLLLAGLYTHACIRNTALDAYQAGFDVVLAAQAMASTEAKHAAITLDYLSRRGVQVLECNEQVAALPPLAASRFVHHDPCNHHRVLFELDCPPPSLLTREVVRVRLAQAGWAAREHAERQSLLRAWQECLVARRESVISLICQDLGKPLSDAVAEFDYALKLLVHACGLPAQEAGKPAIRYRPHGVAGLITPWNNPLAISVGKLAPALVFGNAVVWKPALEAARISELIASSLQEAGLGDVFALIQGDHEAGRQLACMSGVDCISFTGATANGRQLQRLCAEKGIPLQAEMGGNNAVLVMADADLEMAARDIAQAMFSFAGQRCTASRRIIVESSVRDIFAALLKQQIALLPAGQVNHPQTRLAPLISRKKLLQLLEDIRQAREQGAGLLCGGQEWAGAEAGNWLLPTVLTDPPLDSPVLVHESFGPLALLIAAENGEQAIAYCNAVEQGLLACLYSNDPAMQQRFLDQAQAGMLAINQARPAFAADAPFSAWKASGAGLAEHGRWARDFFTRPQVVYGWQADGQGVAG